MKPSTISCCLLGLLTAASCQAEFGDETLRPFRYSAALESNPHGEGGSAWCAWEWRLGGELVSPDEVQMMEAAIDQWPMCEEARAGLMPILPRIRKVDPECTEWGGTYHTATGVIRVSERYFNGERSSYQLSRILAHEYGHKQWAIQTPMGVEILKALVVDESYEICQPGSEGETYEERCTDPNLPNWNMSHQLDLYDAGLCEEPYDPASPPPSGGGGGDPTSEDGHWDCDYEGPCFDGMMVDEFDCVAICGGTWNSVSGCNGQQTCYWVE
jgi:hypothetical protein